MPLPTRGQSDWDDDLNNYIEDVKATVDTAAADALAAKTDAATSKTDAAAAKADAATAKADAASALSYVHSIVQGPKGDPGEVPNLYLSGAWYPLKSGHYATENDAMNKLLCCPFVIESETIISEHSAATATVTSLTAGNYLAGIYAATAAGAPGDLVAGTDLVVAFGSVATDTHQTKVLSSNVTLAAGLYYYVCGFSGTGTTFRITGGEGGYYRLYAPHPELPRTWFNQTGAYTQSIANNLTALPASMSATWTNTIDSDAPVPFIKIA